MPETPFEVGPLLGHAGGTGPPALLLHGGAAVPDYLDGLAAELADTFSTFRYTQRGTPPSAGEPPFTIEAHLADALAVLDAFDLDRAWVLGHSWGGHLALHLLVAHPERLLGVVAVDPLGAFADALQDLAENVRRRLSPQETAVMEAIEERRRQGHVTEEDLIERFRLVWPAFFADHEQALPPPERVGVEASVEGNRSLADHFERRTLLDGLSAATLPVLFVHGELSAFPARWTFATADLIRGSEVVVVPDAGHLPWIDRPGSVRRAVVQFLAR